MDAQRFDNLARTLANRLTRRHAIRRAGAAAAASLLAATGIRPDQASALIRAQNDGQPLYTLIRHYTLGVPGGQVRQALQQGYVAAACQAPGFVAYLTVEDEEGDFSTIAVFQSQNDLENFANAEANWIAQNLDDLLPAPDEAISGDTYVHAAAPQGFPNTCATPAAPTAVPAQQTAAPGQPTAAPAAPTAVPSGPTPTPAPVCTAQGCVCSTGTQAPCDAGLVCCPTTDLMGGPGVCRPQDACYPSQCRANGQACPRSCGTTEACPACCSNYCSGNGECNDPPPPCTGEACQCTPGVAGTCDDNLVCCQTNSSFGPLCVTQGECASAICPFQFCGCTAGVQGACNDGLVCCTQGGPGSPGTCQATADCLVPNCTGETCSCDPSAPACDSGLVCCPGTSSAGPTCTTAAECASTPCSGHYCYCPAGTDGSCGDGLVCCPTSSTPGGDGICLTGDECNPTCTGQGCGCSGGVQGACADGLICCQDDPSVPGGPGTCQTADNCGVPPCISNGVGCTGCNWGENCSTCCSGFCNGSGVCDGFTPSDTCISDGVNCGTTCNWSDSCGDCCSGFCDGAGNCNEPGASAGACGDEGCGCELGNPACLEGLLCCDDGSGVTGICAAGC